MVQKIIITCDEEDMDLIWHLIDDLIQAVKTKTITVVFDPPIRIMELKPE